MLISLNPVGVFIQKRKIVVGDFAGQLNEVTIAALFQMMKQYVPQLLTTRFKD